MLKSILKSQITTSEDALIRERILREIDTCREDERSSQAMILQTISVAGAVLGAILAAGIFSEKPTGSNLESSDIYEVLFLLSVIIFIAAFAFVVTLGIKNVLRYINAKWILQN